MKILYTLDGKKIFVFPVRGKTLNRAVAAIGLRAAALGLRSEIFNPALDDLRTFVLEGIPDIKNICPTYPNRDWTGNHVVCLEFVAPNLVITVTLFNSLVFILSAQLEENVKVVEFKIVQRLSPKMKAGLFLKGEDGKFKFEQPLEGAHVDSLFESLYSKLGQELNLS